VHPRDQNDRFTSDELVSLFTRLKNQYGGGKKQEKFWIPLIALFTSCRLNEICQLTYKDVEKLDGIWCFRITAEDGEEGNKSLKTVYSQRNIPIHKTLINLGFIEYIQSLSIAPTENIWGLKYEDSRNKYGRTVGRTFNDLRKELFDPPPRRKTFHSLRHTFATFFRKVTADNELVMYFDGHSSNNQTFGRYAKYDDYKWMKSEIDKLKYPQEVEKMFKGWMK
jgi:integrase